MSNITRWDPFKELEEMRRRLAPLWGREALQKKDGEELSQTASEWAPSVDITEDDKEYIVRAELPGIRKEDIKVTVEHHVLIISGERRFEQEEKGKKFHRIECNYGSFERTFSLPENVDTENVQAEHKDGVLLVHLAKTEAAKPKQIEVKVA